MRAWPAMVAVPVMLLSLLFGVGAPSAQAAGDAQLLVTVEAVDASTGAPVTSVTSSQSPRRIAFRVDFSCVSAACDNATVKFDPTQLDPNYDFYRLLGRTGFTPPLSGGIVTGSETSGYTVALGNLPAGASGQFTLEYGWQDLGQSGFAPDRQDYAYGIFPDGFPITQTVRGNADTAVGELTATTTPVTWDIPVPDPTIWTTNLTTPTSGFFSTDTNITYQLRMATGCKNDANRFTYDFQCSSAYTVTHQLPPGAELVTAAGSPTVSGDVSTGLVLTWVGPPWAATGSTSLVGWAANPRAITIIFPRENVAPAGQTCDFTTTFNGPTGRVDATYISMPGTPGAERTATLAPSGPFQLKCSDPFPRAQMDPKQSTYDGSARPLSADASVVVPATGTNNKEWRVTVYNTANIAGVAVVTDDTLDQPDLPVHQIVAPAGSTIVWTATDGTTTVSGTSTGTADAPAGFRFATSMVTSPELAPPNTIPEQNFRTAFTVRYLYKVSPDAPGGAERENTASAVMQWPGHPEFPDTILGPTTGTVVLIAPFGRIDAWKGGFQDTGGGQVVGGANHTNPTGVVDMPIPTSTKSFWWNAWIVNSGNAPAIATITDTNLNDPELPITQLQPLTWSSAGGCCSAVRANIQYTLDDGTTGTASNVTVYNVPAGRRIASFTATTVNSITGGSTTPADGGWVSFVMNMGGTIGANATPDSLHPNTFTGSLNYQNPSVPNLTDGNTFSVHLVGPNPTITARFGPTAIAGGASTATTTTDVTFALGGTTSQVPLTRDITPEYVFMAPAAWNITQGSASFPAGSVPAGVQLSYRTVTVAGVQRQVVVASWPEGTVFGENTTLPNMSVIARPTAAAPAGAPGVARGFITNTNDPQPGDIFTSQFTDTPDIDGIPATVRFSEANPPASVPVGSVAAMQVLKEICFPDASQPDGCRWYADASNTVGVPPNSTSIKYRISVTNTGNTSLSDPVGYDVLPYPGDTGTSDATGTAQRGSTFQETINTVTAPTNGATATYSDATQPCRLEVDSTVASCVNDWDATPSGAQAIRIARAGALAPGASFSMTYDAAVVNAPGNGAVACNSFAVRATGLSNVSEPAPVCASIEETDLQIVAGTPQMQEGRPGVLPWTVTNLGGAPSTQGEVGVAIPAGLEVTSFTPTGWVCTAVDGDGDPVFGTAIGPATLTCTPNSPLLLDVPQPLNIPVRPTTTSALTIPADVSGRMFDGNMANNEDEMSVTPTAAAGDIEVTKDDGITTARPGDLITYTVAVGNPLDLESLNGGTLTDTLPSRVAFVSASNGGTESGGKVSWALPDIPAAGTITRTVTVRVSSTINTAELVNVARASAPDPANPGVNLTGTDDDIDSVVTRPEITIVKGSVLPSYAAVGEVVNYTFAIQNTGDVTLTGVAITDELPGLSGITYTWGPSGPNLLAPNEQVTATAQYTITQADIDAGHVANTATVAGNAPNGDGVDDTDDRNVFSTAAPHVTLTKTGSGAVAHADDVVTYSFELVNDGAITLHDAIITDPLQGLSDLSYEWPGEPGVLAPGQSVTATATYAATQDDVDAGQIVNTATGTGLTPAELPVTDDDTFTVVIASAPAIMLDKDAVYSAAPNGHAGGTITYSFTITNPGNVTLNDVVVTDPLPGLSDLVYTWPGADGVLAPGETASATAEYTVTQADVDAARVDNTAVVTGTAPDDAEVTATDSHTVSVPAEPSISLEKEAAGTVNREGDTITYTFAIENDGPLTLHDVVITDPLPGLSTLTYEWPAAAGVLAPGAIATATATYVVTQADVDTGEVVNTATATGNTQAGVDTTDRDDATVAIDSAPELGIVKDATIAAGAQNQVGDVITYTFDVTNTGNVTLSGVVVTDPLEGLSELTYASWPGAEGVLAPGETVSASATYTVTQANLDAERVDNTATASGTAPDQAGVDATDSHTIPLAATPSISLEKTATGTVSREADTIIYTFTIVNDGALTLHEVVISDPLPGLSALTYIWPAEAGVLAPGATATASATYTVTQADVDAGEVVNTATVTGETQTGAEVDDDDSATVIIDSAPTLSIDKDGAYEAGTSGRAGEELEYDVTVTNTGNVTLTDVVVTDPLPGLSDLVYVWPGETGVLRPGQSVTATALYTVTQADVDGLVGVTNTATATGTGPNDEQLSDEDTVTMPTPSETGLQLVKTGVLDHDGSTAAGDTVTYRFEATNLSDLTVNEVSITDEMEGLSDLDLEWPGTLGTLAPGQTLIATASYTLTQEDVEAGQVVNVATTIGTATNGDVVTDEDTATVVLPADAAMTLEKTGTIEFDTTWAVGDTARYGFTIVNTGDLTLSAVQITDPMPGLSAITYAWPGESGILAPGETVTATAEYQLTAADVSAAKLVNTATATSDRTPDKEDSVTLTAPSVVPSVSEILENLAHTGAGFTGIMLTAGALLLGVGLVLLVLRRRRRSDAVDAE